MNEPGDSLPSLSLVTCSYQQARFLSATMRSVLEQDYARLEYLVVDGGSSDGSADLIRAQASKLAWWVSEPDEGQTHALIKGFERSTGELMGWLCSDDLLLPGALQIVGRYFAEHPDVDWIYGDALWIDDKGNPLRTKREMPWSRTAFLFDHNFVGQPSVFWRRRLYTAVGGLSQDWSMAMDADLWLRFARHSAPRHLPQYLSCLRHYAEQKTRALAPAGRREYELLRQREAPLLASLPRWPLRAVARTLRVGGKLLSGGYRAPIPAELLPWLQELSIER